LDGTKAWNLMHDLLLIWFEDISQARVEQTSPKKIERQITLYILERKRILSSSGSAFCNHIFHFIPNQQFLVYHLRRYVLACSSVYLSEFGLCMSPPIKKAQYMLEHTILACYAGSTWMWCHDAMKSYTEQAACLSNLTELPVMYVQV
jgi:hypothetical protein